MQEFQTIDELRCKKCNSTQIYRRLTTNEVVCKRCGHVERLEENEDGIRSS